MTEELSTVEGRSVLRLERDLAHPPAKVWRAVTEPAQLAHWFPCQVTYDELVVGATLSFEFRAGEAPPSTGTVTEVDPPRSFAFTWGDTEFRIELAESRDGCRLTFTTVFDDRYGAASFASGWHLCLAALAADLSGHPGTPGADRGELHDHYVDAFGLGAGTWTEDAGGWTVRFERQLTRPAEAAWADLLSGADHAEVGAFPPAGFTTPAVPAGAVTAVDAPARLEYASGGGTVRWEFGRGTGHGARLVLTQSGDSDSASASSAELRATALAAWSDHIAALARRLTASSRP